MIEVIFGGAKLLGKDNGRAFIGRLEGQVARLHHELDKADRERLPVKVTIPEDALISTTFFKGLFGDSITKAGTRDRFLTQYTFVCPDRVRSDVVEPCIGQCLWEITGKTRTGTTGKIRIAHKIEKTRTDQLKDFCRDYPGVAGVTFSSIILTMLVFFGRC